jgi:hypothetical protein
LWKIEMLMVTTAAAPIPAIHPYRQGSVAPTEAMLTVPEKRLARVNYRETRQD